MNEYKIGDFGEGSFKYEKRGFKGDITAYGFIRDIDGKYILFEDNDNYPYLIRKDRFNFELKNKPDGNNY